MNIIIGTWCLIIKSVNFCLLYAQRGLTWQKREPILTFCANSLFCRWLPVQDSFIAILKSWTIKESCALCSYTCQFFQFAVFFMIYHACLLSYSWCKVFKLCKVVVLLIIHRAVSRYIHIQLYKSNGHGNHFRND